MLSIEEYVKDPCRASSLPYWKSLSFVIPPSITVVRDDLYQKDDSHDEPYFKLIHQMKKIDEPSLPEGFIFCSPSLEELSKNINNCYEDISISIDGLKEYRNRPTFKEELWIGVKDIKTNELIGSIIGELDLSIKEGIIEWVEVLKEYRRKGLGSALIKELLCRLKGFADFVTVSGQVKNESNPYGLYLSCCFVNPVIWHILKS